MKIVADEGIEARLVLGLREAGFDVLYIAEEVPSFEKVKIVCDAFRQHGTDFQGAFSVIDENYIRIRH
ncbi:MAG TPA: hypothetical protein DCR35_16750 [Runella sp.]|nr:hypothetical protein [Runella sp.]HAO50800.1 hypothetical protein [Runella sp.]